jgi:hypothetical protein
VAGHDAGLMRVFSKMSLAVLDYQRRDRLFSGRHRISPTLTLALNSAAAYLLESFPFLGFFFSRFCLSLLMKEVCHDFPVTRSATQPDTRLVAVMTGVDAQFILLSGSASVSSGVLRFFSQAGQPLSAVALDLDRNQS